ncbi:hypothetical protein GGR92_001310 [Spirosoma lacussanchae]
MANPSGLQMSDMINQPTTTEPPLYRKPALLARFDTLVSAESTRHGGVSPTPFASLNLGINTDDLPAHVEENRRRFFQYIGATDLGFASAHQVHGTDVLYATEPGRYAGYDALITNVPGLLVGVTVADCVPILLYDPRHKAVAAVHAGWRGTVGRIVVKTLAAMTNQFGTDPADCYGYIGTCIDACSFEVGPEVADQFAAEFVQIQPETQRPAVDLKAANRQQLIDTGLLADQIELSPFSTVTDRADYFSYRAEKGQTGRMLAVIGSKC